MVLQWTTCPTQGTHSTKSSVQIQTGFSGRFLCMESKPPIFHRTAWTMLVKTLQFSLAMGGVWKPSPAAQPKYPARFLSAGSFILYKWIKIDKQKWISVFSFWNITKSKNLAGHFQLGWAGAFIPYPGYVSPILGFTCDTFEKINRETFFFKKGEW